MTDPIEAKKSTFDSILGTIINLGQQIEAQLAKHKAKNLSNETWIGIFENKVGSFRTCLEMEIEVLESAPEKAIEVIEKAKDALRILNEVLAETREISPGTENDEKKIKLLASIKNVENILSTS